MKKIALKIFNGDAYNQCVDEMCPDCGEEFKTLMFGENICTHCGCISLACEMCPASSGGDIVDGSVMSNALKVIPDCKHCPFDACSTRLEHLRAVLNKADLKQENVIKLSKPWKRGIHTLIVNGVGYHIGTTVTVYGFTYHVATLKVVAL